MTNEKQSKIEGLLVLAEGVFDDRLDSTKVLRTLDKVQRSYNLSDHSLLNAVFAPIGGRKIQYLVYANIPNAPLPLSCQGEGSIYVTGGKVLFPAPTVPKTGAEQFEKLFAPVPEQYNQDSVLQSGIESDTGRDTRYIQHTVSLRNKHKHGK